MNELALFAGAGGGILGGSLLGWKTICAVEANRFCRKVLMQRQEDKILPFFPIWNDARTFRQDNPTCSSVIKILSETDNLVVTAGFPCQPYSSAGKRKGKGDKRNLWPDTMRIIREMGPRFVLLENVPGLLRFDYFGKILGDLADAGFDAEWDIISAAEVGAPHKRNRLWMLAWPMANTNSTGRYKDIKYGQNQRKDICKTKRTQKRFYIDGCRNVGNCWWSADPTELANIQKNNQNKKGKKQFSQGVIQNKENLWGIKSQLGRVADGVANRVDRLSAIGNGQVSLVAAIAFVRLAKRAGFIL